MNVQNRFKGIIAFVLLASIALFNTVSFAQSLQDDIPPVPGIDKPPLRMTGGQHIMMHDDEIVGFLTPPEGEFPPNDLRGWMFYPDGYLNLATHDLDMGVDLNMQAPVFYGLTATATGRIHITENDEIFVCSVSNDDNHYIRIAGYDPATGKHYNSQNNLGKVTARPENFYLGRYIDCAISDINGNGVDELVIAYYGQDGHPELIIANKPWNPDGGYNLYAHYSETDFTLEHEYNLAVTAGDFDGDGDDEIALAAEGEGLRMTVFLYDVDADGSIVKKDSLEIMDSRNIVVNRLDIASGDMDGDGNDEIVATSLFHRIDLIDVNATTLEMDLITYSINTALYFDSRIATGDLDGDGDDEVLVAFESPVTGPIFDKIGLNVFDFDNNLDMTNTYGAWVAYDASSESMYFPPMGLDIVMGNFDAKINETDIGDIGMEVALVYRTYVTKTDGYTTTNFGAFRIQIYDETDGLGLTKVKERTIVQEYEINPGHQYGTQKLVVAAGDFDGDSLALGQPDHWIIEDHIDFMAVIAEPPKHIDYLIDDGILTQRNVSRVGGAPDTSDQTFYTEYKYTSETETKTTDLSSTDYDWGVQVSVEGEKDFGIPVVGAVKVKVEASTAYDYSKKQDEWNSSYSSQKRSDGLRAVNDDFLLYVPKTIDIWRYPVIGETEVETEDENEDPGQLYVQLTFPSNGSVNALAGTGVEWYQPVHENGNIFSYPWTQNQIHNLGDIKTESYAGSTDRNELTCEITWTNGSTEGEEVTTTKKLAVDASLSVSGTIMKAETAVEIKGHYDKTWASLNTSETTNSTSQGITISRTALDATYAYKYYPLIYENSKLGVLQVDYTVALINNNLSSSMWWTGKYDNVPDLALNLPYRWKSQNYVDWEFNDGLDSDFLQLMKGLFFLDVDQKPFGFSIKEGEQVTIKARVYNYSFVDVENVDVKIESQVSADNKNWGDRIEVGTVVNISSIRGFQNSYDEPNWKYAEVLFNTTDKAGNYYRFWVTVDPDDTIEEMPGHDTGETYDNNEGWFSIPLFIEETNALEIPLAAGDLLHEEISISDENPIEGGNVMISATVSANDRDFRHVYVSFYDGDPDEGGEQFDTELIPYITDGGSYTVSVPYKTYGKKGTHEIHAVINGKIGEYDYTNNITTILLRLTVDIDGCDSEVADIFLPTGNYLSDEIAMCAESAKNHGKFVSCVSQMANDLKKDGIITGKEKSAIQSCAAQANLL